MGPKFPREPSGAARRTREGGTSDLDPGTARVTGLGTQFQGLRRTLLATGHSHVLSLWLAGILGTQPHEQEGAPQARRWPEAPEVRKVQATAGWLQRRVSPANRAVRLC